MKNTAILLVLFVLFTFNAFSQGINIFDIDTTNYPIIKAKFYAYDKDGKIQRPTKDQLKIIENGIERKIIDVSCPIKQPIAISSVLTFDVSGSMSSGPNGVANLDLAKTAAKSWIAALPTRESQAAITSFDHQNYIIQDFTNDKNKLLKAIEKLKPQGGTDYNKGFIEPMGGGILMAKTGKFKRVLIFLTDGQPNFEPDIQKIINEAKINNITIFAVTLGMTCPQNLKDISLQTDGYWYENMTTLDDAKNIYLEIMRRVQDDPCDISWESGVSCGYGIINLEIKYQNMSQSIDYRSPQNSIFSLEFNPKFNVVFKNKSVGKSYDTTITIKAINSDVDISNITSSNPQYDINPKIFKLTKNESKNLTITYTPNDDKYNFTKFEFLNNLCSQNYNTSAYTSNKKNNSIKLTHPNGGEVFVVGSDSIITWGGIAEKDEVTLSFSNDSGKVWNVLDTNARDLKYLWQNIPKPTNDRSLIKVEQNRTDDDTLDYIESVLKLHDGFHRIYDWSPDGQQFMTVCTSDSSIAIWDAGTLTALKKIKFKLFELNDPGGIGNDRWLSFIWVYDLSKVIIVNSEWGNDNNYINLIDLNTGNIVYEMNDFWTLEDIDINKNEKLLAVIENPFVHIIDLETNNLIKSILTIDFNTKYINGLYGGRLSDNGEMIFLHGTEINLVETKTGRLIKNNNQIRNNECRGCGWIGITWINNDNNALFEFSSGLFLYDLASHNFTKLIDFNRMESQRVHYNEKDNTVLYNSSDSTLNIFNLNTRKIDLTINQNLHWGKIFGWSKDYKYIHSFTNDTILQIFDAKTGENLYNLKRNKIFAWSVIWHPYLNKLTTPTLDSTVVIWYLDQELGIQTDISDAVFSIVAPEVKARFIDMKKQLVGTVKDSVIVGFIENIGSYKCRIDSIYFEGEQFDEFQVVSGIPVFTVDVSKNYNVEFRFKPKAVGIRKSTIVIITQADTLRYNIIGEGIEPMVQVLNNFIDFGKVKVNENKDSLQAQTIKNIGSTDLNITKIYQYGPNLTDFKEINGLKNYTLKSGEELKLDLSFKPTYLGRTSGTLMFEYEGIGSPAVVQLFGEGIPNNPNCDGRGFVFDNFHSKSNVQLVGSAELTQDSTIRLTDTKSNQVGGVTYGERMDLKSTFEMKFSFRMSNGNNNQFIDGSLPGADGIAVLFQNGRNFRTTANGGSLGFNGIENCVALEIDMYKNDNPFFDPNGNHVALQVPKDNIITAEHSAARTVAMNDQIFILRPDSTVYYGKLVYDADKKQIQFFLDSTNKYNNLVLTAENFDFSQYLQLELGDFAHIGITSTTGAATQIHELLSWEFCSERDEFLSVEDRYYESDEVKQIDNILKLETGNIKEIEVMDITGKVLINKEINNNEINLNELEISTGIYFIILKDDQNRSHFRKVNVVR